jgi:hypothetical protein
MPLERWWISAPRPSALNEDMAIQAATSTKGGGKPHDAKNSWSTGRHRLIDRPSSRTGENPPYGMIGGTMETSASFEARSAPSSYPTLPHSHGLDCWHFSRCKSKRDRMQGLWTSRGLYEWRGTATLCTVAAKDITVSQTMLRHAKPDTTAIYTHGNFGKALDAQRVYMEQLLRMKPASRSIQLNRLIIGLASGWKFGEQNNHPVPNG